MVKKTFYRLILKLLEKIGLHQAARRLIEGRKRILIATPDADADAVCTMMTAQKNLQRFAQNQKYTTQCALWAPEPPRPNSLFNTFTALGNPIEEIGPRIPFEPDLCIAVDYGGWVRMREKGFPNFQVPHLGIDHHPPQGNFPGVEIIDLDAASSTCVLYDFLESSAGLDLRIDPDDATCLLAGLVADTGRFGNKLMEKPSVYKYAAIFESMHARCSEVSMASVPTNTLSRLIVLETIRKFRLLVDVSDGGIALFWFTPEDLNSWDAAQEDCLTMFTYLLSDFSIVAAHYWKDGSWYCSLRSGRKTKTIVAPIAQEFGGGGHPAAAGFSTKLTAHEVFEKIKQIKENNQKT